jgi:hypothetical protein
VPYDRKEFYYFVNRIIGLNLRIYGFRCVCLLKICMEHPYP